MDLRVSPKRPDAKTDPEKFAARARETCSSAPRRAECCHESGGVATLNHRLKGGQAGLQVNLLLIVKNTKVKSNPEKLLLLASLILSLCSDWTHAESTPLDSRSSHVNKSDVLYFFDSISFENGKWRFALSRNSMGMLWRTIDGKDDVTGVCNYHQTLVVPKSSSLEVKNKDIAILFRPSEPAIERDPAAYTVWLRIGNGDHSTGRGGYATVLELRTDGAWGICQGYD
jgi:hypothetical protein